MLGAEEHLARVEERREVELRPGGNIHRPLTRSLLSGAVLSEDKDQISYHANWFLSTFPSIQTPIMFSVQQLCSVLEHVTNLASRNLNIYFKSHFSHSERRCFAGASAESTRMRRISNIVETFS